ncbi:hypothetical protein B0H15DRAFT_526893 [Mycena belliarum]|uniref:GIY-YIG domain-containing protein n=1 Tax=Mycena belliarum TaxID=1033014 RepID=A0AAD6TYP1_9AGAR|nr:hypothetical protein B0H15DRAFT_526893 [Mycena belliae]
MAPRPPTTRSSLFSHAVPSFYACYLLKSVQTPTSTATYIGSTPNPPKRIRQHNGELTQGAHKTRLRRPWVMQMIVYGFPSKLAALQFEWAWQHAHMSRHLRDADGRAMLKRANTVSSNIRTVRLMVSAHPWCTWPLHVKLFTDAAVKGWRNADEKLPLPLPPGFTCATELEGVDGKSGQVGSGRQGPLSVDDALFTSAYLAKNTALLASNRRLTCSVCQGDLSNYSTDPLNTTLCPATGCMAVSHLSCLAEDFLSSQAPDTGMIPRGGRCSSCNTYVLWGDIVRGMYRRSAGGALAAPEGDDDALFLSDIEPDAAPAPRSPKARGKAKATVASPKRGRSRLRALQEDESSEGEVFDFTIVSSSTDSEPSPRKRGRSRKASPPVPDMPGPSPRKRVKPRDAPPPTSDADMPASPSKKRAPKSTAPSPSLATKPGKRPRAKSSPKKYHTSAQVAATTADSSDFFDSDSLGDMGSTLAPLQYPVSQPSNLRPPALNHDEADFFHGTHEFALSRAMSELSVAGPGDREVIMLSDSD